MFLEEPTFLEKVQGQRSKRPAREYDLGSIYAVGGDNRAEGRVKQRDIVLGREVRRHLTGTGPTIKRLAHPEAVAALENDAGKGDPRWQIQVLGKDGLRCALCGALHQNPILAHTYRSCPRCAGVLTLPSLLHDLVDFQRDEEDLERMKLMTGDNQIVAMAAEAWKPEPLYILAASLGHPHHASMAVDVSKGLRTLLQRNGDNSILTIPAGSLVHGILSVEDPCPGQVKMLQVRYERIPLYTTDWRKAGIKAEVKLRVEADGLSKRDFFIKTPAKEPLVKVNKAQFGHPLGGRRGRGAFDVTEILQGRLDETDGAFLEIPHTENLYELFGDPAKGMEKDLKIDYELMGISDTTQSDEMNDYLTRPLVAKLNPRFAPLVIIRSATFGLTKEGGDARRKVLRKQLYDISVIAHRKKQKLPCQAKELERLDLLPALQEEFDALHPDICDYGVVDVRFQLQRLVDNTSLDKHAGGSCAGQGKCLRIAKGTDLRELLLNGNKKTAVGDDPKSDERRKALERTTRKEGGVPVATMKLNGEVQVHSLLSKECDPDEWGPLSTCKYKQLLVDFTITGHDSERRTSSEEVTESGGDRNFIRYREGSTLVLCTDEWGEKRQDSRENCNATPNDIGSKGRRRETVIGSVGSEAKAFTQDDAKACMKTSRTLEDLNIEATTVFPLMKIENAYYGHHTNPRKQVDVKSNMESIVETQGRNQFEINRQMNLQEIFRVNPLRGYRKLLKVGYVARGLMGTLRVPITSSEGTLVADLFVGFPPLPLTHPVEIDSERATKAIHMQQQLDEERAAKRIELQNKSNMRQKGGNEASRRRRRTEGGLVGRRVIIMGIIDEKVKHLNGARGVAVAYTSGLGTPSCRYSIKLDVHHSEDNKSIKKFCESKYVQILALKLSDESEPDNEEKEEDERRRRRRLRKEKKRGESRQKHKEIQEHKDMIRFLHGKRGLLALSKEKDHQESRK